MNLPHCDKCKAATTVKDLVTDEGWAVIERAFFDAGFHRPDRSRTEVFWVSTTDKMYEALQATVRRHKESIP